MRLSIRKIFPMFCCLLISVQSRSLQAAEHQAVDTNKWIFPAIVLMGTVAVGSFFIPKIYNYFFNKNRIQNYSGSYSSCSIEGEGFVVMNGYVIPAHENAKIENKNGTYYVNGKKANIIGPSGEKIRKQLNQNIISAINIPQPIPLTLIYNPENTAETNYIEIDKNFADDVKIYNRNGSLEVNFIQKSPPSAYKMDNGKMAHIIAKFESQPLDVQGSSHVILQSDQGHNIPVTKLSSSGSSKVNILNTIEGNNNINLNSSGQSEMACKDVKVQTNLDINTSGQSSTKIDNIFAKNIYLNSSSQSKMICKNANAQRNLNTKALGQSSIKTDALSSENIYLNSSDDNTTKINSLHANTLSANGSGTATISINDGKVEEQTLNFSNDATYKAQNLESTRTKVNAQGLSSLFLKVIMSLTGQASNNSTIKYQGNPQADVKVSGLATCKRK